MGERGEEGKKGESEGGKEGKKKGDSKRGREREEGGATAKEMKQK